jgi:hypothetical protein
VGGIVNRRLLKLRRHLQAGWAEPISVGKLEGLEANALKMVRARAIVATDKVTALSAHIAVVTVRLAFRRKRTSFKCLAVACLVQAVEGPVV